MITRMISFFLILVLSTSMVAFCSGKCANFKNTILILRLQKNLISWVYIYSLYSMSLSIAFLHLSPGN